MFVRVLQALLVLAALCSSSTAEPTLREINSINGFDESIQGVSTVFSNAFASFPGPKIPRLDEAWVVASEGAFDSQRMTAAIEEFAASKLDGAQLSALHLFFTSPLGRKISAMEIAASQYSPRAALLAEGGAIFATLPEQDPERLALYRAIVDGLGAVDIGESTTLNLVYAMIAGMVGAANTPLDDEQIRATALKSMGPVREEVEKDIYSSMAWMYRDLALDDLRLYLTFLETPAAVRYYDLIMTGLDRVMAAEAKVFGHRLFVALGLRKA